MRQLSFAVLAAISSSAVSSFTGLVEFPLTVTMAPSPLTTHSALALFENAIAAKNKVANKMILFKFSVLILDSSYC
jgi:predicted alternative tryptophan synthase beta-subunit